MKTRLRLTLSALGLAIGVLFSPVLAGAAQAHQGYTSVNTSCHFERNSTVQVCNQYYLYFFHKGTPAHRYQRFDRSCTAVYNAKNRNWVSKGCSAWVRTS